MKAISAILFAAVGIILFSSCMGGGKLTPKNSYTFDVVGDWLDEKHIITFRVPGREEVKITRSNQCVSVRKSDFQELSIDFLFKKNFSTEEQKCNNSSEKEEEKCTSTAGNKTLTISDSTIFLLPEHSWGYKIENSSTRAQGECLFL